MFGLFKRRKAKKEAEKQLKMAEAAKVEQAEEKPVEKEVAPQPKKEAAPVEDAPKKEAAPVKEEPKKVEEAKKEAAPKKEEPKANAEVPKVAKYHVSQNKDKKSPRFKEWRVRKEGSNKTIKYFQTQAEAIELAKELADKAGSSVVIHKVDGSIRKQDYSQK